jgi:predicted MPP superfamily phosphohydrolase
MFLRFLLVFVIIIFIEVYFLQAVKTFSRDFSPRNKSVILYVAYGLFAINFVLGIVSLFYPPPEWKSFLRILPPMFIVLVVCKLFGCSFLLIDDIIRLFRWLYKLIFSSRTAEVTDVATGINRLKFLSQLAITFTVVPAISFLYGMVKGAYKYRVHNVKVDAPNIPAAFHGFKIVQLSDMHTGSFFDSKPLSTAFEIVMQQKPDLILFTGDLVNNTATETNGFTDEYKKLKAPFGVFSVLGNHDYGDYVSWDSQTAKHENLEALKKVQADCGWRLLMNEHVALEKDGEKIALLGIENWGGSMRFPKYGKMKEAHKGTEDYKFKILMSHDPSHWDKQVRTEYPDIDLTLSGHTHGMQFGIEIPGFKWSPVQYLYKQWAGLYKQDNQYLYVNRGLGFLGYPGRLGIWPEITVIELNRV